MKCSVCKTEPPYDIECDRCDDETILFCTKIHRVKHKPNESEFCTMNVKNFGSERIMKFYNSMIEVIVD